MFFLRGKNQREARRERLSPPSPGFFLSGAGVTLPHVPWTHLPPDERVRLEASLTPRQLEIYRLRSGGMSYRAIALYLGVTWEAVRNTQRRIEAKMRKVA